MIFKNHRTTDLRVCTPSGHVVHFDAGQEREVPEAHEQDCIEAGLVPVVETKKRGAAAKE